MRLISALFLASLLVASTASAQIAVCQVTGPVYYNGVVSPNTRVTFTLDHVEKQVPQLSVIRPGQAMRMTDSNGNMASISLPQGAIIKVTIGNGAPVTVTVPNSTSTTMGALVP